MFGKASKRKLTKLFEDIVSCDVFAAGGSGQGAEGGDPWQPVTAVSCDRNCSSGEDGCESHAGGCTQEPVLGGGSELPTAELQLAACSSMGFDGEHARLLWSERSVRNQSHNVFR